MSELQPVWRNGIFQRMQNFQQIRAIAREVL